MFYSRTLVFLIGIAQGIAVGTAFAAFMTILDIIYRLVQITKSDTHIRLYEKSLIFALPLTAMANLLDMNFNMGKIIITVIGGFMGVFIGLLASALAEVLNVIPVLVDRLNMKKYVDYILVSLIAGKVFGSMIYWLKVR